MNSANIRRLNFMDQVRVLIGLRVKNMFDFIDKMKNIQDIQEQQKYSYRSQ